MTITRERQPHYSEWETDRCRYPRICTGFHKRFWDYYREYAGEKCRHKLLK